MKNIQLDKLHPRFRQLTDLLFFSDRQDIQISEYKYLLKSRYIEHFAYLYNRFTRCTDIFWENGEQFWFHRLNFLLSLNDKKINESIEEHLTKRMSNLVRSKCKINLLFDIEYLQFLQLCKVKKFREEDLSHIKKYLTEFTSYVQTEKLIDIINTFIPAVFENFAEYTDIISRKIIQSSKNLEFLQALKYSNITFDKLSLFKLATDILIERAPNVKNRRAFLALINDLEILNNLKQGYQPWYRDKIINLLKECDYREIEENHLINIKNLIQLDETLADDISIIYVCKLFKRKTNHKRANADRILKLLKICPQISPKKILAFLSSQNKISDIKYILNDFPTLKKLAAFV